MDSSADGAAVLRSEIILTHVAGESRFTLVRFRDSLISLKAVAKHLNCGKNIALDLSSGLPKCWICAADEPNIKTGNSPQSALDL